MEKKNYNVKEIKEILNNCDDIILEPTVVRGQYTVKCNNGCLRTIRFKRAMKKSKFSDSVIDGYVIEYKVGLYNNGKEWWSWMFLEDFLDNIRSDKLRRN